MYDQLAASVLVDNPGLVRTICDDELRVEVEFDEEANHLGELSKTGRCSSRMGCVRDVDPQVFYRDFIKILNS